MAPDSQNRVANRREIMGVVMLALTTLLFLALITDGYEGESRRSLTGIMEVPNFLRSGGALIAGLLSVFLGPASHALYFLTCVWGIMLVRHKPLDRLPMRLLGMFVLAGSLSGLLHVDMAGHTDNTAPGGAFGAFMGDFLQQSFGVVGANVIAVTLVLVGVLLSTEFLFLHAFEMLRGVAAMALRSNTALFRGLSRVWAARQIRIRSSRPRLKGTAVRNLETLPELVEEPETVPIIPVEAAPKTPLAKTNLPVTPVAVPETPKPSADDLSRIVIRTAAPVRRSEELPPPRVHILPAQQDLPLDAPVKPAIPVASDPEIEALLRETRALLEQEKEVEVDISALVEAAGFDDEDEEYEEDGEEEMVDEAEEQAEEEEFEEEIVDETPFEAVATPSISEDAHYTPFQVVAGAGDEEMDEEPATVEPVQEEFPEVAASAPDVFGAKSAKPKKPRFRIKSSDDEELPPNYEYPKFYTCPSIEIFDPAPEQAATDVTDLLRQTSVKIEETFKTFNIEARVTEVLRGPTITRFELQPAPGIKVSRFLALTDDIALSLKAQGVRIEAPIPGKGRVGIEVPNKHGEPVVVRDLFESDEFRKHKGKLKLALGKDIAGDVTNADLTSMPHLLVAGATGAGKTVCIKTFLASLLYAYPPDEMQLILVDPKMVELSIFNDIPHLITPVVTDPKKASTALNWLINEMEERYRLFAHLRTRNIEVYNERVENGEIEMIEEDGNKSGECVTVNRKLPYIVCIIDELADLMMLARSEVECSIARLAQLARATGIHLIIATQRPSVDVLTGVIKANFPARMSFQVSSRVDSRCILDEIGAERLIGKGDMLYLPAGRSKPTRIQGAFVSDREMDRLIAYLKTQAPPQYRDEIENFGQAEESKEELLLENDELFEDAVRVVLDTGQASISMVQRRLRVGYTRAARLIDMMELKGIVGPHTGSKAREILVNMPRGNSEVA